MGLPRQVARGPNRTDALPWPIFRITSGYALTQGPYGAMSRNSGSFIRGASRGRGAEAADRMTKCRSASRSASSSLLSRPSLFGLVPRRHNSSRLPRRLVARGTLTVTLPRSVRLSLIQVTESRKTRDGRLLLRPAVTGRKLFGCKVAEVREASGTNVGSKDSAVRSSATKCNKMQCCEKLLPHLCIAG